MLPVVNRPRPRVLREYDPRGRSLARFLAHFAHGKPFFVIGAGASLPLVPLCPPQEQHISAIGALPSGFQVIRDDEEDSAAESAERRLLVASALGSPVPPDLRGRRELDWWIRATAASQRLDPDFVRRLIGMSAGSVSDLVCRCYSAVPTDLRDPVKTAGYRLLRYAPRGCKAITTNQDRLLTYLTHLDVTATNGQIPSLYLHHEARDAAPLIMFELSRSILEPGFVLAGTPQPSSLAESEFLDEAWRRSKDATAVIFIGYSFAKGLDGGCWQQFCRHIGPTRTPVFVVDPDADRSCTQLAYGMRCGPPEPVPGAWQCLASVILA